jgi:hypothetical protein
MHTMFRMNHDPFYLLVSCTGTSVPLVRLTLVRSVPWSHPDQRSCGVPCLVRCSSPIWLLLAPSRLLAVPYLMLATKIPVKPERLISTSRHARCVSPPTAVALFLWSKFDRALRAVVRCAQWGAIVRYLLDQQSHSAAPEAAFASATRRVCTPARLATSAPMEDPRSPAPVGTTAALAPTPQLLARSSIFAAVPPGLPTIKPAQGLSSFCS